MHRPSTAPSPRSSFRAGATAVAPVLLGIVPFGFVAGVAATEAGLGLAEAVGFSSVVFAGASQLAAIELLGSGAPAWVAIMTAVVINLRMAMYSASLGSYMTDQPVGRRVIAAYLLTDQAYALSIARYREDDAADAAADAAVDAAGDGRAREVGGRARAPIDRWWFYLGTGLVLWMAWQITTVLGVVVGGVVPEQVPLGFAVPLTFLCLLVPSVTDRPTLVAAAVGGGVAFAAAPLPANLGMPLAATAGVLAGYAASRRAART